MHLSRLQRYILFSSAAVAVLLAAATIFLLSFNWNRARPFVGREVSASLGRDFAIDGDLKVVFVRGLPSEPGWRRYLPRPRIEASAVRLANPGWSGVGPEMIKAKRISIALHPLALLRRHAVLTDVVLEEPELTLQRRADGSNTWTMKGGNSDSGSGWDVEVQRLAFARGKIRYLDEAIGLDLHASVDSIADARVDQAPPVNGGELPKFGLRFQLDGRYRDAAVKGSGMAGAVLQLEQAKTVYPVRASAELGANKASIEGTLTDPRSLSGIDLQLTLGGASMADLYPLTGVLLPKTPAYATKGRLIGKKSDGGWDWGYRDFTGTVGESNVAGTLEYLTRQPRPLLRGKITSTQLRLVDLAPTVGADDNKEKQAHGKAPVQPKGKALPVEQFNPEKWGALDADVTFSGRKLLRTKDIPLQDIAAEIHMKDRVLSLTPLDFGMAGGTVTSNVSLDGRQHQIEAQIKLAARHLKVRSLFPALQSMQASFGEVHGDAALTGRGNSVSAMLASSNGELGATVSEGSISRFILEAAGLNIPNALFAKVFGDKQVHLNCMASEFKVNNGNADVRQFALDTEDARVDVHGSIDAARETLDLDVRPQTKGARIVSLRTPLYAKGSFKHPDIGPYKGPIALKAAAAGALALVTPAAAILPLVKLGNVPDFDCASALAAATRTRESPKAPAASAPAKPVTQGDVNKAQAEKRQ